MTFDEFLALMNNNEAANKPDRIDVGLSEAQPSQSTPLSRLLVPKIREVHHFLYSMMKYRQYSPSAEAQLFLEIEEHITDSGNPQSHSYSRNIADLRLIEQALKPVPIPGILKREGRGSIWYMEKRCLELACDTIRKLGPELLRSSEGTHVVDDLVKFYEEYATEQRCSKLGWNRYDARYERGEIEAKLRREWADEAWDKEQERARAEIAHMIQWPGLKSSMSSPPRSTADKGS